MTHHMVFDRNDTRQRLRYRQKDTTCCRSAEAAAKTLGRLHAAAEAETLHP